MILGDQCPRVTGTALKTMYMGQIRKINFNDVDLFTMSASEDDLDLVLNVLSESLLGCATG